ncbi:CaiB/BaiF CoA-transferase family protein [Rhodococcus sp. IEGM 1366]|uniref:CaiB/BaiF CoA transferase family protein n=1 Tax=Rhodococcus sp. IEGM 1366 TaxID=3082223 RepID=UPI0029557C1A|nr:CaiB/BaiF CoA-transferase family protein [Rhodococcus sp. IEGM 1366]MDV8071026.1 CaiB/BaiF CoA-transferase family protein [Rhodococcus sp. IEGM 1366]
MAQGPTGQGKSPSRPLEGVRVLAVEQMQALPYATQMLARLGAEVVKVEPLHGESGRSAQPSVTDEAGRPAGATFLRNNLGKRSIAIDLKSEQGRELLLRLAESFDVFAENLGPGRADRYGLSYETLAARNSRLIYLSVTGFGKEPADSPYSEWPAYACVAEAMTGIYEYSRRPNQPPVINPVGGLGDTGTGLFGVIGVLAALRHRETTGLGQLVDIAMYDSMLSICDLPANYWSMGMRNEPDTELRVPYLLKSFRSKDGWCVLQVSRPHQFKRLAQLLGHDDWISDDRFAHGYGWYDHWTDEIQPALENWAAGRTTTEAAAALAGASITAAPCFTADQVVSDTHARRRNMLIEIPRTDGVNDPVIVAGNAVKLSAVPDQIEPRPPLLGEHTVEVLADALGLEAAEIADLTAAGILGCDKILSS